MRISDWSSDVCSSDLPDREPQMTDFSGFDVLSEKAAVADADRVQLLDPELLYPDPENVRSAIDEATIDEIDRKSVVEGKSVSVRVELGGRRIMKKKNKT